MASDTTIIIPKHHHRPTTAIRIASSSSISSSSSSPNNVVVVVSYKQQFLYTITKYIPIIQVIMNRYQQIPLQYKYYCFICWIIYKVLTIVIVLFFVRRSVHTGISKKYNDITLLTHNNNNNQLQQQQESSSSSSLWIRHLFQSSFDRTKGNNNNNVAAMNGHQSSSSFTKKTRILYIVTSLAEYNTGKRNTIQGQDRLYEIVLPTVLDSITTILSVVNDDNSSNNESSIYNVDVYFILAYTLLPHRYDMIRQLIPMNVGIMIWDNACPYGYDPAMKQMSYITNNTRALARQHRYVIKDLLPYYDVFVVFEDDMRITGTHIQHYIQLSNEIEILRQEQMQMEKQSILLNNKKNDNNHNTINDSFFGNLTVRQYDRLIPGFIRVEVLQNENIYGAQTILDPIELDYTYNNNNDNDEMNNNNNIIKEYHFDPQPCCYIQHTLYPNQDMTIPNYHPNYMDVILWETNSKALSVRQLPKPIPTSSTSNNQEPILDWITILPGPGKRMQSEDMIQNNYWSGTISKDHIWNVKPSPGEPDLIAQQGGWMATQQQIVRLNNIQIPLNEEEVDYNNDNNNAQQQQHVLCQGSFLPPFDLPIYRSDGQESMNVEYWSGGYQLFTGVKGGCNMYRFISMKPEHYSKHFIYHIANNKQKQLSRQRMVRADHLWGQLNSVRKAAIREKLRILSLKTS